MAALKDEDVLVRAAAAEALGGSGFAAADALQQLVIALTDEDAKVRSSVLESLGRFGPAAGFAVKQTGDTPASAGRGPNINGSAPPLITEVCDQGYAVSNHAASLPGEDVIARLAQVDPRDKAHGLLLQYVLSMCSQGGAVFDPIVANAVVHSIWCCRSGELIRSALKFLPEAMKMLELSTFQQRWLVQRALQMWPSEAVERKLHKLLLEPKWGDDSLKPAEQATSEAGSNEPPGLGPVDTDASLSYQRDESLACSSGDVLPAAMWACPWSQSSVESA